METRKVRQVKKVKIEYKDGKVINQTILCNLYSIGHYLTYGDGIDKDIEEIVSLKIDCEEEEYED